MGALAAGALIGGAIGGVGSLLGGQSAKSNDLTGYNYLTGQRGQPGVTSYNVNGVNANTALSQLAGLSPITAATGNAFNNYLNSTGYNFTRSQGMGAITGSAAARGILNSGSTGKALMQYGQGLAGQTFGNYTNFLGGLANQGLTATQQIGAAGTQGGMAAGGAMSNGIGGAAGALGGMVNQAAGLPGVQNFFSAGGTGASADPFAIAGADAMMGI